MAKFRIRPAGLAALIVLGASIASQPATARETALATAPGFAGYHDNFDRSLIDAIKWSLRQADRKRVWVDTGMYRTGGKSLAIRIDPDMRGCGATCQRNEIRTRPGDRVKFGEEAWYAFSFRLTGARSTSRWVSGQWKQQAGGSPFIAQRIDGEDFTITVQDNDCRVEVASSKRTGAAVPATRLTGEATTQVFPETDNELGCTAGIKVERAGAALLPNPWTGWVDMTYRVRGSRTGNGLIEIWANGRFIARVTGSVGRSEVAGPHQYFKFGIYREFTAGSSTAYFDNFIRAATRQELEDLRRELDGTTRLVTVPQSRRTTR